VRQGGGGHAGIATPAGWAPARSRFQLLIKPTGSICNLDCAYCYFLSKDALYPGDRFRMSDETLERTVTQLLEAQPDGEVTVAWQGGEPTLLGVDFFRRAVELAEARRRPGQRVRHTIQTNGTLLTDEWARMLAEHEFLVGISIDGPPEIHDRFRVDKRGQPTSARVLRGLEHLRRHGVDVNVLCTVHAGNQDRPLDVYRYFRDEIGIRFIQFIPIVERHPTQAPGPSSAPEIVTDRSVDPGDWGRFLSAVFDEWFRRDIGTVFVQLFDMALAAWSGFPSSLCLFGETCGRGPALMHNGDVYSCDHFVDPDHLLGNIDRTPLARLVASQAQRSFGRMKVDALPVTCRACEFLVACRGECPKNRLRSGDESGSRLNYLCSGYRSFWAHVDGPMRLMAGLIAEGRPAGDARIVVASAARNAPCPCGSGRKAKHCHQS
jgi:uncharacterized protein